MKKGLSLILVIALVASLAAVLGACGGKGENDAATESTEQSTTSPWKDLLEDYTYDYEDESYTERTTDEHYEEEYEALTLPSAKPSNAASANATTAATTKTNATRVTTTKAFMFTSPSQPSTTKKTETTAASGSTTTSTTQATSVTDSTSMTDNISETNVGFDNVTEGGSTSRPQVTYLDKYVVDILAGSSYTLQAEMKAEGTAVPMTNYKDGNNSATKMRLSSLVGAADMPNLGGLDEVRVVIKDSKLYIAWATGYVQMVDQDMEDFLSSMKDMDIHEMLRTDALEYVGVVSGTGYVCESYRIPEENLGYSFYFTSNGITRVEVVNLETRQVVETMSLSLKAGVSDKNAFTLSGKMYTMEEFEKIFEGMAG